MIFVFLLIFLGLFLVLKMVKSDKGAKENLPPGPWGFPLVGHLPLLVRNPMLVAQKWRKKYGPIVYCRFGSFPVVLLFGSKLTKEAFKMPEMAGRPDLPMIDEIDAKKGVFFSEGSYNSQLRNFTLTSFKKLGVGGKILDDQIHEGVAEFFSFIKNVEGVPVKSKDLPKSHILQTLVSMTMSHQLNDKEVQEIYNILDAKIVRFGSFISELAVLLPWLDKLVHFLSFGRFYFTKGKVQAAHKYFSFVDAGVQNKKRRWIDGQDQGQEPQDLMDMYFQKMEETTDVHSPFYPSHDSPTHYVSNMFAASLHTGNNALTWAMYYLARYPLVQKKLQQEIDIVLGSSRLPALDDRAQNKMPYTENFLLEMLRKRSFSPFFIPHKATEDVDFHGYTIKKGTLIFADAYGIHHDKDVWGDPEIFRPERWEGEQGQKLKSEHFLAFSTGRRKCPGDRFAMDQLFLYVTTLCQRYNLELYGEESQRVVELYGLTSSPSPFQLKFASRHL